MGESVAAQSRTAVSRGLAALMVVVAVLAAAAAGAGVSLRGDGGTRAVTSARGEAYEMVTGGVYANNPERVVAEGVGWDYVTLLLVAPAAVATAYGVARGSLRARLVALGLLAYFFYQYFMYALFWAVGPLFPLFIVLFVAAGAGIVWICADTDVRDLGRRVGPGFPRRGLAMLCFAVSLLLVVMWSQRIALALAGDLSAAGLLGQTTLTVQVLDLGLVVPFALITGVLLLRRAPVGYLLGPVLAVKGVTMAAAICAMLAVASSVEGRLEVVPFAIFASIALLSGWLGLRGLKAVETGDGGHSELRGAGSIVVGRSADL